ILRSSKNLTTLLLGINFFEETIPDDAVIYGFENLQVLDIGNCLLSGEIPLWISKINRLTAQGRREDNGYLETSTFNSSLEHGVIMVPQGKGNENKLTFSDIVKATNNFNKENIIGCGGYGLVYKAELPDGCKLAIKKLNDEMCLMEREFTAEVEALSMAQHDHLVPLWGYCIQGNSRFLIYSYMENGSLDDWLHNRDDDASTFLDWPTRLRIAQGASRGLSYIHNDCKPQIVHRDIKCSNILLDKELKAYVADFGLSRLILPNKTHVTTELVGTLGYIPPEYAHGWVATLRARHPCPSSVHLAMPTTMAAAAAASAPSSLRVSRQGTIGGGHVLYSRSQRAATVSARASMNITCCANQTQTAQRKSYSGTTSPPSGSVK
ncbi:hypothetical protein ACJX0J_022814, partial [Zea mays]